MKICMLAYTFYESDNRVMRYAEALARQGHQVDAVTLLGEGHPKYETMHGVEVCRIQRRVLDEARPYVYARKLLTFLCRAAWFLAQRSVKTPYDLVHVHNIPDFLVFAALIPKLRGAKIILDIHDLVPEFYASKFREARHALTVRFLKRVEKMSIAFSDFVLIANDIWRERLCGRSVHRDKVLTMLNYPDETIFSRRPPKSSNGTFVVIYPGSLSWHQGLDVAIKAFALLRDRLPQAELHIYGDGHEKPKLRQLVEGLGLQNHVLFHTILTLRDIKDVIAQADLGLVPKRKDSFGDEAFSTKILEFMAIGVPVVASDTTIDKLYFDDTKLCFFTSGDPQSLADSIVKVHDDVAYREKLLKNAFAYVASNNWGVKQGAYLQLVERLTGKKIFPAEKREILEAEIEC